MRAIILAAGMGRRLGKYTKDGTKCMVTIHGKALIDNAIEAIAFAGIREVTIVVGYRKERLIEHIGNHYPDLNIEYIANDIYDKTNNIYSLWLARHRLAEGDTLLLESDLIFDKSLIKEVLDCPEQNVAVISQFESWMDGTVTLVNEESRIVNVIEKRYFRWSDISTYYKTVNIYKFSCDFMNRFYLPFLDAYLKAFGNNIYYEQVIKVLAFFDEVNLFGYKIKGNRWYEIDDPHDLAVAETLFSPAEQKLNLMSERYGGYWRFPSLRDFCYLVNPYFPVPAMIEEFKTSFPDLLNHYPSGARIQSQLAGKIFNLSESLVVVGNGAAEIIDRLFSNILDGTVVCPVPTFNEYPSRIGDKRFIAMRVSDANFEYSVDDLIHGLEKGASIAILVNPDNPSGHFLQQSEVRRLVSRAGEMGRKVVVDESFVDFADSGDRFTLLDENYLRENPHLTVLRSISKSYGIPGCRIGLAASGDEARMSLLRKSFPVWNINSFGEFFLQIFDKYKEDYYKSCNQIAAERNRFFALLAAIPGLIAYPSAANYIMCRIDFGKISAHDLATKLLDENGILIKDLTSKAGFDNGEYIRVAVKNREDNNYILSQLAKILS